MAKTLHFKTNTLLKNLVGKDLINDDNIAIVELVKNAYDANSDTVLIKFEGFSEGGVTTDDSRLIISDEGSGMTDSDIEDKWLNIAYSEKKLHPREHGAYFAGNKGIGRFSCDRLGEHLDMLTRMEGGSLYHLQINWPDFEVEGNKNLTIQRVGVTLSKISEAQGHKISGIKVRRGTVLVISRLRTVWDREKLLDLKKILERFINPNQLFLRKKFVIQLSAEELAPFDAGLEYSETVTGVIQNQIFKSLKFNTTFIEASISADGRYINTTLSHEGEAVFRLKEKNTAYPLLKNISTVIYYLNPYKKAYFKRQTGIRSLDFGSIFLFLNGFRVAPYGERGDDWLGLDFRKSQGTNRYLSSRELIGRIEVVDNEDLFKPISSREGLKKTQAFAQLKEIFFIDVLRKLEKFVVEGLDWDSIPETLRGKLKADEGLDWKKTTEEYVESWDKKKQRIALTIMTVIGSTPDRIISFWFNPSLLEGAVERREEEIKKLISDIDEFNPGQVEPDLKKNLRKLGKLLSEKDSEAKIAKSEAGKLRMTVAEQSQVVTALKKEKDTYRAQTLFLQSVSTLDAKNLLTFHHQICLDSSIINNYLSKAIRATKAISGTNEILQNLEKISRANRRILATAQFATKANFKAGTKKELTDIPAFIEQYILNVAKDFIATGLKLDVRNSVNEPFELKANRIELTMFVDNIISNSNKANARKLIVEIEKKGTNGLAILFRDDGVGLPKEVTDIDSIFGMGVTTTSGSGLGLYHVRQIIESLDGTVKAIPIKPKGFEIQVRLIK